jgi:hypothetical protein
MIKALTIDYSQTIAKPFIVAMVNYNFFSSLVICKTLVGLYSSPGLLLKEGWINREKDKIIPCLAGSKKEDFILRGEKGKTQEDSGKLRWAFKSKKRKI